MAMLEEIFLEETRTGRGGSLQLGRLTHASMRDQLAGMWRAELRVPRWKRKRKRRTS